MWNFGRFPHYCKWYQNYWYSNKITIVPRNSTENMQTWFSVYLFIFKNASRILDGSRTWIIPIAFLHTLNIFNSSTTKIKRLLQDNSSFLHIRANRDFLFPFLFCNWLFFTLWRLMNSNYFLWIYIFLNVFFRNERKKRREEKMTVANSSLIDFSSRHENFNLTKMLTYVKTSTIQLDINYPYNVTMTRKGWVFRKQQDLYHVLYIHFDQFSN